MGDLNFARKISYLALKGILNVVYKIPYRRARAWPSGCIGRVRRASKGILHTILNAKIPLRDQQRYLAYQRYDTVERAHLAYEQKYFLYISITSILKL